MARIFLLLLGLLTTATFAAPFVTTGRCQAGETAITVGVPDEPWDFPADNWDFHPFRYTDTALSTESYDNLRLSCTLRIDGVVADYPPYDVAFHTRYTDPGLLFYHTGLLLRQDGKGDGYRVLFSTVSKDIALYRDGVGFLAARPCALEEGKDYAVVVEAVANRITVRIDGKVALEAIDRPSSLPRAGKVGVFALHGRGDYSDIRIDTLPGSLSKPPRRDHPLITRQWHRWLWVFDGDEPIARFMKYDIGNHRNTTTDDMGPYRFFGISDAKLRPGTPPATPWQLDWDCTLAGANKLRYKTLKRFEVRNLSREELEFRWELALQATGEFVGRGTMTVRYDAPNNRYIYDCRTAKILDAPLAASDIQYADPWPYWAIGPATDDMKTWPRRLRYFVYTDDAGVLRKIPLNHHWPAAYTFKPGTIAVFVSDNEVNPAFELLTEGQTMYGGLCNWGLDLHLQLKFTKEQLPLPKGKELTAKFRVTTYGRQDAQALLAGAKFLDYFQQAYGEMKVPINTGQVLNRFGPTSWVKPTDPFDAWIWEGLTAKNWDQTTGVDDTFSLRLEKPGVYLTKNFGAGGYYGVFPKGAYELRAMVKTQGATGKGAWLSVLNWPLPDTFTSEAVAGTTDWTLLRARFPGPIIGATLRLHLDGPGTAWVDNVQVVKVE